MEIAAMDAFVARRLLLPMIAIDELASRREQGNEMDKQRLSITFCQHRAERMRRSTH
jgi:hypothetical protein